MIGGLFQAIGVVLLIAGAFEILIAKGLLNQESPFVTYRIKIGAVLLLSGAVIVLLSLLL